nr:MAG TPA: hypothetical protein [Caudoviricetes sp.]
MQFFVQRARHQRKYVSIRRMRVNTPLVAAIGCHLWCRQDCNL